MNTVSLPVGMFSPTNRPCPRCGRLLPGPYARWFQCKACRAVVGHVCGTLTVHRAPVDVVADFVAHCVETGNRDLVVPDLSCVICGGRFPPGGKRRLYCGDACRLVVIRRRARAAALARREVARRG
jgi:predicted nucleic acid-binding Zn ribbon protein